MSVQDKIDQVLVDGEFIVTSQEEADEIIKKALEQGYGFSASPLGDYEIVVSQS